MRVALSAAAGRSRFVAPPQASDPPRRRRRQRHRRRSAGNAAVAGAQVQLRSGARVRAIGVRRHRGGQRSASRSCCPARTTSCVAKAGFTSLTTRVTVADAQARRAFALALVAPPPAQHGEAANRRRGPAGHRPSPGFAGRPRRPASAVSRHSGSRADLPDTEAYDRDRREPVPPRRRPSALDLLDRRRHRVVRERAAVPQRGPPAARRRRPRRGADQLLPASTTATRRTTRRSPSRPSWPRARGTRSTSSRWSACRRSGCRQEKTPPRNSSSCSTCRARWRRPTSCRS